MYNNVIVVPLLPKIADCAQQDRVLDLTRLFPSLAVGKGSGPRDYEESADVSWPSLPTNQAHAEKIKTTEI